MLFLSNGGLVIKVNGLIVIDLRFLDVNQFSKAMRAVGRRKKVQRNIELALPAVHRWITS